MILVLVGLGSPGQIAANIAVTDGYLISEIDSKLEGKLENKKLHIWIVVSCAVEDFVLIPNTVVVEDAGVSQGQCAKQG